MPAALNPTRSAAKRHLSNYQFIATAGPNGSPPAGTSSISMLSQPASAVSSDGSSIFGTLGATSGPVSNYSPSMLQSLLGTPGNPNQSTVVASGSDLSSQWAQIQSAAQSINSAGFQYSPLTQNSNSAATTELSVAGITPPVGTDIFGSTWAPAATVILSIPGATPTDPISVTYNTDFAGDPTTNINMGDETGNVVLAANQNQNFEEVSETPSSGNTEVDISGTGYAGNCSGAFLQRYG